MKKIASLASVVLTGVACGGSGGDGGGGSTSHVGTFDGLFDDVLTGYNFPLDLAVEPAAMDEDTTRIFAANYGTSEVLVGDPADDGNATAFFDGSTDGLRGTTAVSAPAHDVLWVAFEQGGATGAGGIAILSDQGERLALLDGDTSSEAFQNPGGLCWGGWDSDKTTGYFYLVNLGDGTLWRIAVSDLDGSGASFEQIGDGLAVGALGTPGTSDSPLTSSGDTPVGGARGCAVHDGWVYVADAQNARVMRFDASADGGVQDGAALEDTPAELLTHPTGLSVNDAGDLVVISSDNAHAFVSLEIPSGAFLDNGLHDLNVNSGNFGIALAATTIWFTRANNRNGSVRAITPDPETPPSTLGPTPAQ